METSLDVCGVTHYCDGNHMLVNMTQRRLHPLQLPVLHNANKCELNDTNPVSDLCSSFRTACLLLLLLRNTNSLRTPSRHQLLSPENGLDGRVSCFWKSSHFGTCARSCVCWHNARMASPRLALSPIKITTHRDVHNLGKKPLPESTLKELKIEISYLLKQDKEFRYLLGQRLDILQKERARGRTGTFMADLREMRINYHKANRLIKFYRRAQSYFAMKREQEVNMAAKWGNVKIEDAEDFERALASKEADERLAAINVLAEVEREKVKQAQASRAKQPTSYKVGLVLSDTQKERFKKAWSSLKENERSSIVFKAIIDAAK